MKKLISLLCFALCMHSITKPPSDLRIITPKNSGEKQLIKALAAFVYREGNKHIYLKRIDIPPTESPWL